MKVKIVPIGNSKGIRIPKALLKQCGFGKSVEITVEGNRIVLRSSPPGTQRLGGFVQGNRCSAG